MKKYIYDPKKFQSLIQRHNIRPKDLQNLFNYQNTVTILKWRNGYPIYGDKICAICNAFGIDIKEFFEDAEVSTDAEYKTDFEKSLEERAAMQNEENGKSTIPATDLSFIFNEIEHVRVTEREYQQGLREEERKRHESKMEELQAKLDDCTEERNRLQLLNKELELKLEQMEQQFRKSELMRFKGASRTQEAVERAGL